MDSIKTESSQDPSSPRETTKTAPEELKEQMPDLS